MSDHHHPVRATAAEHATLYSGALGLAVLVALWRMPVDDTPVGLAARIVTSVAALAHLHLRSQREKVIECEQARDGGLADGFDIGLAVRDEENVRRLPRQRSPRRHSS